MPRAHFYQERVADWCEDIANQCASPLSERAELEERFKDKEISYHELADFYLPENLGTYLDYGCGDFTFARKVVSRVKDGYGVDVLARATSLPDRFQFLQIPISGELTFSDNFFDTISIIEVIEHVRMERPVLEELARVMKRGGTLVITTPHKGLLTWIDSGNWKVHFPIFHRWIHVFVLRDRENYEKTFGKQRQTELFGDLSGDRHKHYSVVELADLVPRSLRICKIRVSYPGMRLFWAIGLAGKLFPVNGNLFRFARLRRYLSRRFSRAGDQLVVVLTKT